MIDEVGLAKGLQRPLWRSHNRAGAEGKEEKSRELISVDKPLHRVRPKDADSWQITAASGAWKASAVQWGWRVGQEQARSSGKSTDV